MGVGIDGFCSSASVFLRSVWDGHAFFLSRSWVVYWGNRVAVMTRHNVEFSRSSLGSQH